VSLVDVVPEHDGDELDSDEVDEGDEEERGLGREGGGGTSAVGTRKARYRHAPPEHVAPAGAGSLLSQHSPFERASVASRHADGPLLVSVDQRYTVPLRTWRSHR
jgi:hypothetical protein